MKAIESARMMRERRITGDRRTQEELLEHYTLEVRLASRLMGADREERRTLYTALYDELFAALPHHPQLTRKEDERDRDTAFRQKFRLVSKYVDPHTTFLEVGSGDGSFATRIAGLVKQVYAVDVSSEIVQSGRRLPENFRLVLSDGRDIPLPDGSVTVAYSNQLMEHLHPDDAAFQLREIHRVLERGGHYICITPSRLAGPHDISRFFDSEAKGFHLHEYTTTELQSLFRDAGFDSLHTYAGGKGYYARVPGWLARTVDSLLERMSDDLRQRVANWLPVRAMLGVILVGRKR